MTPDERETCLRVLQWISEDPSVINNDERMKALISKIHREGKKGVRRGSRAERQEEDRAVRQSTAMAQRSAREHSLAESGPDSADATVGSLHRMARCYICKEPYAEVHFFYHLLCPGCAAINYERRTQRADLSGRVAVITGGRIKIGYQTALRMLRDGARVIVTTRFPADATRRFAAQADCAEWRDRLQVHGLDLRNLPQVEAFTRRLGETEPHADILINNAAQTIKRPLEFYQHLLDAEAGDPVLLDAVPAYPDQAGPTRQLGGGLSAAQTGSLAAVGDYFPCGALDPDGQQVDRRPENSWSLRLHEVSTLEMLEVHLVNAVAPFVLCRQLKPLLERSPFRRRFIVNVSAMEGQFARPTKTVRHPHTNMAKAALNMLTRTAAADLAETGIYMNSVDTGWITDEHPYDRRMRRRDEAGFATPLDVLDGVARIYDPVVQGVSGEGEPPFGQFLKDYASFPW